VDANVEATLYLHFENFHKKIIGKNKSMMQGTVAMQTYKIIHVQF